MDRGSLRESHRRQPGARGANGAAGGVRRRRQAGCLARRLQLQQRRLSAAGGLQYRGANVPVGGLQDAGLRLSGARLVHQHGRPCRLSRSLGDGITHPRNRVGCGRPANRHRSDRDPPPQLGHTEGSAHHLLYGHSARGHHACRMPRQAARELRRRGLSQRTGSRAQRRSLPRTRDRGLHRTDGVRRHHHDDDGRTCATAHRADRQDHRDDEHAFAGSRHRNDHGTNHCRAARRGLRGRHRFRGRQFARGLLSRRGR